MTCPPVRIPREAVLDRIGGGMESMPAVDAAKCLVVGTLYAVLH